MFTKEVSDQLKYYVYRLIDPRNGETFYVGKGTGNRVFAHVKGELGSDSDALTDKLQRIRDIRVDGFEVAHVIHRHGLDEQTAFEVEAALIDAYPEATNAVGGRASADKWLAATPENFPGTSIARPGRWGFEGHEAPEEIARLYLRRRLPDSMRKRGAANPVKYAF